KVVVDYPDFAEETTVVDRSLDDPPEIRRVLTTKDLLGFREVVKEIYVDRMVREYAVGLTMATREPARFNLAPLAPYISFGASPRASIYLIHAGRALALLRGRRYLLPGDVRDVAADVLRHRISLTYEALAEEVSTERMVSDVIASVPEPPVELAEQSA
ncbi:MAG: AAA family ATPase, partial [Actinomycetota bacterium]